MVFLVHSQSCAVITTIRWRTFHHLKKKPCAHEQSLPKPLARTDLLSLWICLFWKFPRKDNSQSVVTGSFYPHNVYEVHPCCSTLTTHFHSSLWLNNIPWYGQTTVCLSICSSADGHLGCFHFGLLWICFYEHSRTGFCVDMYFHFSWLHS